MKGFLVGSLSGLGEPMGGLFGSALVAVAGPLTPVALAFAAGAMIFVISDETIPETHRRGFETVATFSLIGGFALMMLLEQPSAEAFAVISCSPLDGRRHVPLEACP